MADATSAVPSSGAPASIVCSRCRSLLTVPSSDSSLTCPSCNWPLIFRRCPDCSFPAQLADSGGFSTQQCEGCGSRNTQRRWKGVATAADHAAEVSKRWPQRVPEAEVAAARLRQEAEEAASQKLRKEEQDREEKRILDQRLHRMASGLTIAAEGFPPLAPRVRCAVEFRNDGVIIFVFTKTGVVPLAGIPLSEVGFIRIAGRGRIRTVTPGIIPTSRTTIETTIHLNAGARELMMVTSDVTPEELQVRLAPVFARLEEIRTRAAATSPVSDLADEVRRLAALRDEGLLSDEEFATAKARLLGIA